MRIINFLYQVELRKVHQEKEKVQGENDKLQYELERVSLQHTKAQGGLDKSQEEVARLQVNYCYSILFLFVRSSCNKTIFFLNTHFTLMYVIVILTFLHKCQKHQQNTLKTVELNDKHIQEKMVW